MVTLAYENEDVASLSSFEKKGEFFHAQNSRGFVRRTLHRCPNEELDAPRFNLLALSIIS